MSRRYMTPATSRNQAVRELPHYILRSNNGRRDSDVRYLRDQSSDQQEGSDFEKVGSAPEATLLHSCLSEANPLQSGEESRLPHKPTVSPVELNGASIQRPGEEELTQEGFDKLLALFDQDREMAGQKYEIVRRKLQKFFECRGCPVPNELADETIDVVARKIDRGQEITGDQPAKYFYGVARNVLREYWRRSARWSQSTESLPQSCHPSEDPAETVRLSLEVQKTDRRLEELERCLGELGEDNRELIVRYYDYPGTAKKSTRRALAHQIGIRSNALRLRIHRIKLKLRRNFSEPIE